MKISFNSGFGLSGDFRYTSTEHDPRRSDRLYYPIVFVFIIRRRRFGSDILTFDHSCRRRVPGVPFIIVSLLAHSLMYPASSLCAYQTTVFRELHSSSGMSICFEVTVLLTSKTTLYAVVKGQCYGLVKLVLERLPRSSGMIISVK